MEEKGWNFESNEKEEMWRGLSLYHFSLNGRTSTS